MNKDLRFIIAIIVVLATALSACKKKSSSKSTYEQILGTWQLSKQYIDTNHNKIQDANELTLDTNLAHESFSFNTDSSFTNNYDGTVYATNKWALINNNTYIHFISITTGLPDAYMLIQTLNEHNLVIKDSSSFNGGITWTYLTR